ncbi:uncharacterized protein OCT59_026942 [Rhizophagus irregularis]|uniref:Aldo/keto reductase n=2 Tax=Rhizophagus irregularis (strain DAOM 181602 / DAOM 197198 / MUCL 43194) TaxID=747089 RepID=A0A2P4PZF0_RHIID|nr:Aldo/keto reductase [Rhizophagus irregularis DAOM 181602=DAOM 197198]POG70752.1 Aldo/keto reductase [Rhizophagus irregularis DAOM 181602=DAOM 197198]UZO06628.1 hypothetical protein OCT59_026942 [Rhizophagus irregularis]GBC22742.2 aldo/keto reductase [Rhizophagus irregularis DAOM 181602=DAOM 197198]|eukprot:XP_025177618.1 Aldo/keto reductase [Rhizophagus irregularis DAOM 181602=DAOM 197198]
MAQDSTSPVKTTKALDDYVLLGHSGLRVSPLCLGALTFGEQRGLGANKEESKKVFDLYYEKGGNFIDTACSYNLGEVINNTTVQKERRFNPNFGGNHRKSLVENLDGSLKRLNMSYVDILYVHVYEYRTPIEEFMRSLDDVVRSGKVLYVAVSDIPSWALSRANTMAELRGWSPFIGLQTRYNLLDRSLEFDLQPACAELGVGILPWSIVADGFLTGKYKRETNINLKSDYRNRSIINYSKDEKNWQILDEVIAISKEINRSPVQIALNWIQQKPGITSPLIGARTVAQLEENLKSLEFKLTPEQMKRLDDVSQPTGREVPFPYSITDSFDVFIGKNIQVPNKFAPIATTYNYGRLY